MQKQLYRPAKFSLALGFTAVFFAFSRTWMLNLIAVPLGLATILLGFICTWFIQRRRQSVRGTGLAIGSIFMGIAGIVTSVMVMANMATNQFDQRHRQNEHLQRRMGVSPMPDESATNFTSNLPIIVLHTDGHYISKEDQTVAKAEFFELAQTTHRADLNSTPEFQGNLGLHLRGSSTMNLPKHSYTVHTLDQSGNQSKVKLFGLPADEDWVLYAPFEDKTMIRDVLAYQLASKMGHYAPRTRYVELFMNGPHPLSMRDYMGVYVLMEKIKRGPDRVKIAKLKPEDRSEPEITGGYIVKRDHGERPGGRFETSHGGPYFYVYPNAKQINREQKTWLKKYFNSFEEALYGDDFKNPKTGYAAFLDVDYFIDEYWLIEVSKNVDGFRYSSFITKDRGGKIQTGPPWDWNRSFGNANYYGGQRTSDWYSSRLRENEISYYQRLKEDPAFMKRRAKRWHQLRGDILDPEKINATIDALASQLEEAQARNFKRWPILGEHLSCNYYVGETYDDEVQWLKKWITNRIAWIDGQVGKTD